MKSENFPGKSGPGEPLLCHQIPIRANRPLLCMNKLVKEKTNFFLIFTQNRFVLFQNQLYLIIQPYSEPIQFEQHIPCHSSFLSLPINTKRWAIASGAKQTQREFGQWVETAKLICVPKLILGCCTVLYIKKCMVKKCIVKHITKCVVKTKR